MSSILKALQKLEEEKKRQSRNKRGDLPLNQAILTEIQPSIESSERSGGQGGRRLVVAVIVSALTAGGGAATWINHSLERDKKPTPQATSEGMPAVQVQSLIQEPEKKHVATETALKKVEDKTPALSRPLAPSPTANKNIATGKPVAAAKQALQPVKELPSDAIAKQQPTPNKPALRVLGIAYHDSGTNSVAIVNGSPVSIGSIIDGAKVEEIQKDRVRFSYNNERFEILLAK